MNEPPSPPETPAPDGAAPGAPALPLPSLHVPDHELLRRIGRGAYGEVWLARSVTGAFRAVKIVRLASFDHGRPFEREFEGILRFEPISRTHDSQVDILHVGRSDDAFYYVMELADDQVTGGQIQPDNYQPRTLKSDLIRRRRLPFEECVSVGIALTTALEHLHQNGLVHRDVKPSNIIFVNGVAKLADIGLVTGLDTTRSYVGTEGFAAPEGPGTAQADLFSLGKVLYEMSTGKDRQEFPELPTDLREHPEREGLLELNAVIAKACRHDPRDRYANAAAMEADLELLQSGKSLARLRRTEQRLRFVSRAGAVVTALGIVVFGGWLYQRAQTRAARELAEQNRQLAAEKSALAETNRQSLAAARIEAAKSTQIAQFLKDMLDGAGFGVAAGRDTTLLREILDKTSQRVGREFTNQPEVEVELRDTLAEVYEDLGLYKQQEEMAREALRVARLHLGAQSPTVARQLRKYGYAMWRTRDLERAEAVTREALVLQTELFGAESDEVASSLDTLGNILLSSGRFAEAETELRAALALQRKRLGAESAEVGIELNGLAQALANQRKFAEAESAQRQALALQRKLNAEHARTANYLANLGGMLSRQDKLTEAEMVHRESLAIWQKLLGTEEHPYLADSLEKLAIVLQKQGNRREAERLHRQALAMQRKFLGNEDPKVATTLNNLARVLLNGGQLDEAESMAREALAVYRKAKENDNNPNVVFALVLLGEILLERGKLTEAEQIQRETLAARRKLLGDNHPDTAVSLQCLAEVLEEKGAVNEAETLYQELLDVRRKTLGAEHPGVAEALSKLAWLSLAKGKADDAESLARECLLIRERKMPDDWLTFDSRTVLGRALLAQKKYEEAEPWLVSGIEGILQRKDKVPVLFLPARKHALLWLAKLYAETDRPDLANLWNQKAVEFERDAVVRKPATQP